ncbi:MAG TPA: DUF3488 and transglutaminase-like domain-containing protein, partial [Dongiaceae bacterium]|nr:DUF3488 and transglutaminase-like domain-containing protein [Dongiaceae bacterium]
MNAAAKPHQRPHAKPERDTQRHGFPMPRTAFVLLLAINILAVLPHTERVPTWMLPAFVGVLIWRVQVFRERWPFPSRWVRLALVLAGFAGVSFYHGTLFGPDAGVGLLITAYLFKQLEMATRRDAFLVVILSYFVLATEFLFSRSLYTTLYVFLVLILITATQIALNQSEPRIAVARPLKGSLKLVLQSIPLMIVLFYLFPRVGPLWQLNLNTQQNRIGLNDRMAPADIANLSRSTELAFRAEFEGPVPPQRERYWRATVFDRFDGRTWYAVEDRDLSPVISRQLDYGDRLYRYRVYLEPTGQRWLMTLPAARVTGIDASTTEVLSVLSRSDLDSSVSYEVSSYPDYRYQVKGLSRIDRDHNLQLPAEGDPQSRRYAREQFQQLGNDPAKFIDSIMRWYNEEEFVYTLNPQRLGRDSIDEFLFQTRRGFCSHYAGAFVFLLRAAGIPARLVGGYQGGEGHPLGKYLLIHQYDAHAWAEAWLEGQGWVRVDPTAAVAPNRIELGPQNSTTDDSFLTDSPLSPDRLRNMELLARARMLVDYVDYLWFKNVVSYDTEQQSQLFRDLLGEVTPQRIAALLGGLGGGIIAVLALITLLRHPPIFTLDKADRLYLRFCQKLAKRGLVRAPGEGPSDFAQRVAAALPSRAGEIRAITNLYLRLKYAPHSAPHKSDVRKQKAARIQPQPSKSGD